MGLIKFINRKITFDSQRRYMFSYLFGALPIGYIFAQSISITSKGWDKYHFDIWGLIIHTFLILLLCSPFIINYFIQIKKLKLIVKKHLNKTLIYKMKAAEDYRDFVKGQTYDIQIFNGDLVGKKDKWISQVYSGKGWSYELKDIINKFELVYSVKEERTKKLKRLQKIV